LDNVQCVPKYREACLEKAVAGSDGLGVRISWFCKINMLVFYISSKYNIYHDIK
jgi:hypothetical protein